MHKKKLPVPKPAALKVVKWGKLHINADLITCKIENQGTFHDFILKIK